jgi:hypothetical protein
VLGLRSHCSLSSRLQYPHPLHCCYQLQHPHPRREERFSLIQYSAGGLFRWVNNGFQSDCSWLESATAEDIEQRQAEREACSGGALVDFCQCQHSGSQSHWEQLLAYGWFLATPDNAQSAITIRPLKLFHAVSLQGKTTAYHFFNALATITDNTGSSTFKVCTSPPPYHLAYTLLSAGIN